jgi:hypothetical protein
MKLKLVSAQDRVAFPFSSNRADMLQRSAEQASALPIGSVRGTKGAGIGR